MQVWLDDKQVLDYTDARSPHLAGRVGVGTWATQAKFRNLKVTRWTARSLFEGLPPAPQQAFAGPALELFGPGKASIESKDAFNSNACVRIIGDAGETGLTQDEFCIKAGETYVGLALGSRLGVTGLSCGCSAASRPLRSRSSAARAARWREFKFKLRPKSPMPMRSLADRGTRQGDVAIDQVSMMPQSWKATGGFRPDLLKAVADIKPPIIRWPGGCFASPYRWKDGIGPQHQRRVTRRELWDDLDINSLGTDEFIALCR